MHLHNDKRSTQLLLSRVQRRIWHIAWQAWEHRNTFLHEEQNSYHPEERKLINREVEQEWTKGLDTIPTLYAPLFSGTLEEKKRKKHAAKLKWLTTVWSLREATNPEYFNQTSTVTDPLTRYRYMRWRDITNTCT